MKLVDLFCGSGGFALGAHNAGFDVAAAFDNDAVLTSSFQKNFPTTKLSHMDVAGLTGEHVKALVDDPITGVFGGPPCQGFSSIGRRDKTDPRRDLLIHFFRVVSEIAPKFFVMENVQGLGYGDAKCLLYDALKQVSDQYEVFGPVVLDASEFGAATKRRRLFVIGFHKSTGCTFEIEDILSLQKPAATVREAIDDLQSAEQCVSSGDFEYWKLARSNNLSDYARKLRSSNRLVTGHKIVIHRAEIAARFALVEQGKTDQIGRHPRLSWDKQCPTIRAGTGPDKGSRQAVRPLHPNEDRVITVREAARLQGFPDHHMFHPTIWHSFRMIGNSVSPIMSESIFKAIRIKLGNQKLDQIAAE